jgi:hypothetical protein
MRKTPRRVEPHGGAPVVVWPVPYPNRFLGNQYTPVLTIRDQIRPREMLAQILVNLKPFCSQSVWQIMFLCLCDCFF